MNLKLIASLVLVSLALENNVLQTATPTVTETARQAPASKGSPESRKYMIKREKFPTRTKFRFTISHSPFTFDEGD